VLSLATVLRVEKRQLSQAEKPERVHVLGETTVKRRQGRLGIVFVSAIIQPSAVSTVRLCARDQRAERSCDSVYGHHEHHFFGICALEGSASHPPVVGARDALDERWVVPGGAAGVEFHPNAAVRLRTELAVTSMPSRVPRT
jgi:hypothetical protein